MFKKSPLKGGIYHIAMILVTVSAFNWAFQTLTNINLVGRVFAGVEVPITVIAPLVCLSAGIVLWRNWVD